MTSTSQDRPLGPPDIRRPTTSDMTASLRAGWQDFLAAPMPALFFSSFFVGAGLFGMWITYVTGTTFWLVLAVMGFPLVGALAAVGFYEISRRRLDGHPLHFGEVVPFVWSYTRGQLPWLATIIVVIFLFWFFLGHMIFALFLGLSPMMNVLSSADVYLTSEGLLMIAFGSLVGAGFALLVFSISVLGMPMLIDREVDFVTAMLQSIQAVAGSLPHYLLWGALIAGITLVSMIPFFLGLFIAMPVLGHATWHFYRRVTGAEGPRTD